MKINSFFINRPVNSYNYNWLQTAVTRTRVPVFQGSGPASIAAYAATLRALPAGGSIMG